MKEDKKTEQRKAFASNLRTLRKTHSHTQRQLADALQVSESCVSNWEHAMRLPDAETLLKLAIYYSVSCQYLLGSSKRPLPYVPEDKFIDKTRWLDLNTLCEANRRSLLSYYEFLLTKQ